MRASADSVVMVVCGLALLTAMAVAHAQALGDPTRPPAAAANAAAPAAAPGVPESGLQAIIRRRGAKPAAVINGEYVEIGGKSGDARVVDIGEDTVTLQGAGGRETLRLLPVAKKKQPAKEAEAKSGRKAGEGTAR